MSAGRDEPPAQPLKPELTARAAALSVVVSCLEGKYLAPTLRKVLDASGLEGADRSLVADLSYGTVRRLIQLDSFLAPYLKTPGRLPPRVLVALRIGAYELLQRGTPAYAAVSAWVDLVKHDTPALAPLANAVLRRLARQEASRAEAGPERDLALPSWLYDRFVASLGSSAANRAALGMLEPEPLWLTAFSARAEQALSDQGCQVGAGPVLGDAASDSPGVADTPAYPDVWLGSLRVRAPLPLDRLRAYREGLVQPQNPSSLYAALLLGAASGELVFDLAAGHGVKTAVLAASGARVIAVERSSQRNRSARSNLRRLGLGVQHAVADLVTVDPEELLALSDGPVGKVLLDAPCSGTGTLRGHPEIKLRLSAADVLDLARTQAALLDTAARLVAPGGRLLYAVCSLTSEEGPLQAASFLARHHDFTAADFTPPLPFVAAMGGPGRFVLPVDGLDGFYLCAFERAVALLG